MAEIIQGILEDMVADLIDFQTREIFSASEVEDIIKARRNLEYKLMRNNPQKKHFYAAIQYELELEDQRQNKKDQLSLKNSSSDRSIVRRILSLFKRFAQAYKHDVDVWKEYINFCIRSKAQRDLSQVLARALQLHAGNEDMWIIGRYVEEKYRNDIESARALLQRAVEVNRLSRRLWVEYFKFEVEHGQDTNAPEIVFRYAVKEVPEVEGELVEIARNKNLDIKFT